MILGVIEGLTEFLPVSSTGHMILAKPWLDIPDTGPQAPKWAVFLFVSQIGAILAVVLYFWRDLWSHCRLPDKGRWANHLFVKLGVALAPSVVAGLALNDVMEEHLETGWFAPYAVGGALIVGAVVMELLDRNFRRVFRMSLDAISMRQALFIGLAQCISLWPGTSRAMATILGGMLVGLPVGLAARFSFLLAIPTMLLAGGYRLFSHRDDLSRDGLFDIILGTLTAFVVALVVVAAFMQYIRSHRFTPFAVYRLLLGIAVLWWAS